MDVADVANMLTEQGKTVSTAEACTCGLVGYLLGTVPGSSQYYPGGVVAYTGGLKQKVLGVSDAIIDAHGTVSEETAKAMAKGVRELTGTDFAVSTTGVTGPAGGHSGLPVGTFWVGLSVKDGHDSAVEIRVGSDRDGNKQGAAQAAIDLLGRHLQGG